MQKLDEFFAREGVKGMLVLRLIPLVSFNALNYAGGLTPMTSGQFLWTTAVGMLPMEILVSVLYRNVNSRTDAIVGLTIVGFSLLAGMLMRRCLGRKWPPAQ